MEHNPSLTKKAVQLLGNNRLQYSLLISSSNRYIYIDNPKTGCSSLKAGLIELEYSGTEYESNIEEICGKDNKVHKRDAIPFQLLSDFNNEEDPLSYFRNQGYFIFTFVRNPYTRLISGYYNKILGNKPPKLGLLKTLGINDINHPISLEVFIQIICDQKDNHLNPHWGIQSNLILYNIISHSFLGKFENYAEDYTTIFQKIGCKKIPKLRHKNKRTIRLEENIATLLPSPLQELVYKRYQADFKNFGYSYELPSFF